ncbi:MAG: FxSxx-COOH system tetratricopeptide repeat protein [Candidatus Promineifilaceae bacterium]
MTTQTIVDSMGVAIGDGATATVQNYTYNYYTHKPNTRLTGAKAQELLAAMPLDKVPSPSDIPAFSRMKFRENRHFVGRKNELCRLATVLKSRQGQVVISGMGGIGKTQLAVEFVHRYGRYFAGGVYWLNFADAVAISSEVADCAGVAPDRALFAQMKEPERQALVQRAWQEQLPRLLVFDNMDDDSAVALLKMWRPTIGGCRVLVTSRRGNWPPSLGMTTLSLSALAATEGVTLLRGLAARLTETEAQQISTAVGNFPLALYLAGSYLDVTPALHVSQFLANFEQQTLNHQAMLGQRTQDSPTDHALSVGGTFALSWARLKPIKPPVLSNETPWQMFRAAWRNRLLGEVNRPIQPIRTRQTLDSDQLAIWLLQHAACVAPNEPIPLDLLRLTLTARTDWPFRPTFSNEKIDNAIYEAVQRLVSLGLLMIDDGIPRIHPLISAYVLNGNFEAQQFVETAMLTAARQLNASGYPAQLRTWATHVLHVAEKSEPRRDERAGNLLNEVGVHYYRDGNYADSALLFQRSLVIREELFGDYHPSTASSLNNLAAVFESMGAYEKALPLYQRSLAINEEVVGETHPDTGTSLSNLAGLYRSIGEYAKALPLYKRSRQIRELVLGELHPSTASSLNSLAALYELMGEYGKALPLYERSLAIRVEMLGERHPDTGATLNDLALLHQSMGAYDKALSLYERSLAIREEVLGENHPDTGTNLDNLASLYEMMEAYDKALPLYKRSLAINEATLGAEHPDTSASLSNLAGLYESMGAYERALPLYQRSLAISLNALGETHPDTGTSLNNLGYLYVSMNEPDKALPLYQRALAIVANRFGDEHPTTKIIRQNLAKLRL